MYFFKSKPILLFLVRGGDAGNDFLDGVDRGGESGSLTVSGLYDSKCDLCDHRAIAAQAFGLALNDSSKPVAKGGCLRAYPFSGEYFFGAGGSALRRNAKLFG